jgi:hypothetical protein
MNKLLALILIVSLCIFGIAIIYFATTNQACTPPILPKTRSAINGSALLVKINQQHAALQSLTATIQIQATKEWTVR